MRAHGFLILLYVVVVGAFSVYAQTPAPASVPGQPWTRITQDDASFALPRGWALVASPEGDFYQNLPGTWRVALQIETVPATATIESILTDLVAVFPARFVVDRAVPVEWPAGPGGRIDARIVQDAQTVQLTQVFVTQPPDLVLLQFAFVLEASVDPVILNRFIEQVAYSLEWAGGGDGWLVFTSGDERLQWRAPAGWAATPSDPGILSIAVPDLGASLSVNARPIAGVVDLESLEIPLRESYERQSVAVRSLQQVVLPVGEAWLAELGDNTIARADGITLVVRQAQYVVWRGDVVLFITLAAHAEAWASARPILDRIVYTLTWQEPETSDAQP